MFLPVERSTFLVVLCQRSGVINILCALCKAESVFVVQRRGGAKDWKVWTEVWSLWQSRQFFENIRTAILRLKQAHHTIVSWGGISALMCSKGTIVGWERTFFLSDKSILMMWTNSCSAAFSFLKAFHSFLIENDVQWGELKRFQKRVREVMDNFTQLSCNENDHAYT